MYHAKCNGFIECHFFVQPDLPAHYVFFLRDPKTLPQIEPPPRREPKIPVSHSIKKKFPSEIQFFDKQAQPTLLKDKDRERYICLLQKMKPTRKSVREVLCFCFDLHQYAEEVSIII